MKPHSVPHLRTDGTAKLKLIEARFKRAAANSTRRDATTGDLTGPANGFVGFSTPHLLQAPPLPTQPANGTCDETLESSPNPSHEEKRKGKGLRELQFAEAQFIGKS